MKVSRLALLTTAAAAATMTIAASNGSSISDERMRDHVRYLASDELGGRAPGSPGEELTVSYLTDQLKKAGCAPGNPDGTFIQRVPLYGFSVTNAPSLAVHRVDGTGKTFANGSEFVGWTIRQTGTSAVDGAEIVFVGYGVDAPEYGWNDYKDTDVRGKIVVMLVNDPPHPDASLFAGKAMTYL